MEQEFYQRGLTKAQKGDYQGAIKEFDRATRINPDFAQAYYRKGLAYFDNRQIDKALLNYTKSLQLNDQQIDVYYCRGMARFASGDIQGSVVDVNQSISLNPNYAEAYQLRAKIYTDSDSIDEAIKDLKKAAEIYLEAKKTERCRQCLDKINHLQQTQRTEQFKQTLPHLCQTILDKARQGNIREALEDIEWLFQLEPNHPQILYHRGLVRQQYGDLWGALDDYRQASQGFLHQGNSEESQRLNKISNLLQETLNQKPHPSTQFSHNPTPPVTRLKSRPYSPKTKALEAHLYRLVGNSKVAQRLVDGLRIAHPGMSEDWYLEKAIYDLERDRNRN